MQTMSMLDFYQPNFKYRNVNDFFNEVLKINYNGRAIEIVKWKSDFIKMCFGIFSILLNLSFHQQTFE